jgi:hypothetical protein
MALDAPPKLSRKRVLGFATEVTTGTALTPVAADCVTNIFGDVPMIKYSTEQVEREAQGSLSEIKHGLGARSGTATFEVEQVGNLATGLPIWASRLLPACGLQVTAGVWTPIDGPTATITIAEYIDGKLRMLAGCQGNMSATFRRGQKGRLKFTFHGIQCPVADVSIVAPTFITNRAPRVGATTFTIAAISARVPEIEFDQGNKIILREDESGVDSAGAATGYRSAYITGRHPTIKVAPEALTNATKNWWNDYQTEGSSALSLIMGNQANNTFALAAPAMQIDADPEDGDRDGMATDVLTFVCKRNSSAGLDEYSYTMS